MSIREGVYYAGLILGWAVTAFTLRLLGQPNLAQLVGGLVVGVGCGWLAEKFYTSLQPPNESANPSRTMAQWICPTCRGDLTGRPASLSICPLCGARLD